MFNGKSHPQGVVEQGKTDNKGGQYSQPPLSQGHIVMSFICIVSISGIILAGRLTEDETKACPTT